jgi:hypothetical protein
MKIQEIRALSWSEIDTAPETSGIYAWYAKLSISKADINEAIHRISSAKALGAIGAREEVDRILEKFIFGPYRESPYEVLLRGQLKPKYGGEISHEPTKSESLISRLVENPERLGIIADVLKIASPSFTAPLYIGMATNLRKRLKQHSTKISELREFRNSSEILDTTEAGFAKQVAARNFDPTNLFVQITEISADSTEHNDLENILNRINYPIFGRN